MSSCSCNTPVEPGSRLDNHSAGASRVLGVRVSQGFARELAKVCSAQGCTQSDMMRIALSRLAKPQDAATKLSAVVAALGLEDGATRQQVTDAVGALFDELGDPGSADAGTPALDDTAAPQPPADPMALSKSEQDYCTRHKLSATAFAAKKNAATRSTHQRVAPARVAETVELSRAEIARQAAALSPATRAAALKKFPNVEAFVLARANATRRY